MESGYLGQSELIGNHDARRDAMPFQQLSRQLQGGLVFPVALNDSVKDIAIWFDGAPQLVFLPLIATIISSRCHLSAKPPPRDRRRIERPYSRPNLGAIPQQLGATRQCRAPRADPLHDANPAEIQPNRMRDHIYRKALALVARKGGNSCERRSTIESNAEILQAPPRLGLVSSIRA